MKRVAISQNVLPMEQRATKDSLEQNYASYFEKFGIAVFATPNLLQDTRAFLAELNPEAIILSGGNDVDPHLYGAEREANSSFAVERDKTDQALLDYGNEKSLPIFCNCRGAQFLNVAYGGKLSRIPNHVGSPHAVTIIPQGDFNPKETAQEVNSFHSFGYTEAQLSPELAPFAKSADGIIEAVFHRTKPIAGVLWHPERTSPNEAFNAELVRAFRDRIWFWKK